MTERRFLLLVGSGLCALGCAEGSTVAAGGAGGGGSGPSSASTSASQSAGHGSTVMAGSASGTSSSTGSGMAKDSDCPPNEFATDVAADGTVTCATLDAAVHTSINGGCSAYLGWRDSCNGCGLAPSKWGRASGATCVNGVGANDTCSTFNLGGKMVPTFGLNTGGDVDDNDTLYSGLHCVTGASTTSAGPCGASSSSTGPAG